MWRQDRDAQDSWEHRWGAFAFVEAHLTLTLKQISLFLSDVKLMLNWFCGRWLCFRSSNTRTNNICPLEQRLSTVNTNKSKADALVHPHAKVSMKFQLLEKNNDFYMWATWSRNHQILIPIIEYRKYKHAKQTDVYNNGHVANICMAIVVILLVMVLLWSRGFIGRKWRFSFPWNLDTTLVRSETVHTYTTRGQLNL